MIKVLDFYIKDGKVYCGFDSNELRLSTVCLAAEIKDKTVPEVIDHLYSLVKPIITDWCEQQELVEDTVIDYPASLNLEGIDQIPVELVAAEAERINTENVRMYDLVEKQRIMSKLAQSKSEIYVLKQLVADLALLQLEVE